MAQAKQAFDRQLYLTQVMMKQCCNTRVRLSVLLTNIMLRMSNINTAIIKDLTGEANSAINTVVALGQTFMQANHGELGGAKLLRVTA